LKVSETFWLTVLGQLQVFFVLVSVILFYIIPRKGRKPYIELGAILIITLTCVVIGWTGVLVFGANMNMANSIVNFLNLPLAIFLYRRHMSLKNRNTAIYMFIAAFVTLGIMNLFFIQGLHTINSYTESFAVFCFILISMTYHFGYAQTLPKESRVKLPMYWVNIAILVYNCTTFYIVLWVDYMVNDLQSNLINIWMVHNFLGLIYYAILWHGLLLIRKEYAIKTNSHSNQLIER
jgi:hypothetical protein